MIEIRKSFVGFFISLFVVIFVFSAIPVDASVGYFSSPFEHNALGFESGSWMTVYNNTFSSEEFGQKPHLGYICTWGANLTVVVAGSMDSPYLRLNQTGKQSTDVKMSQFIGWKLVNNTVRLSYNFYHKAQTGGSAVFVNLSTSYASADFNGGTGWPQHNVLAAHYDDTDAGKGLLRIHYDHSVEYDQGEWNHVAYYLYLNNDTIQVYLNGANVITDSHSIKEPLLYLNMLMSSQMQDSYSEEIWFDNMTVSIPEHTFQSYPYTDCGMRVAMIFDDGYTTDYTVAYPYLAARGMVASTSIVTDYPNVGLAGRMSWTQIHALADAGWELLSHGTNHYNFTEMTNTEAARQFVESKREIRTHTGHGATGVVYPRHLSNYEKDSIGWDYFDWLVGGDNYDDLTKVEISVPNDTEGTTVSPYGMFALEACIPAAKYGQNGVFAVFTHALIDGPSSSSDCDIDAWEFFISEMDTYNVKMVLATDAVRNFRNAVNVDLVGNSEEFTLSYPQSYGNYSVDDVWIRVDDAYNGYVYGSGTHWWTSTAVYNRLSVGVHVPFMFVTALESCWINVTAVNLAASSHNEVFATWYNSGGLVTNYTITDFLGDRAYTIWRNNVQVGHVHAGVEVQYFIGWDDASYRVNAQNIIEKEPGVIVQLIPVFGVFCVAFFCSMVYSQRVSLPTFLIVTGMGLAVLVAEGGIPDFGIGITGGLFALAFFAFKRGGL